MRRFLSPCQAFLVLVLAFAASLMTVGPGVAIDANEMFKDPAKEERAREIGRQLRCMVCQNQSIFDSNAGLARDLRQLVRERMKAGDRDQEVLSYIADRYGDYVLLEPRWMTKTLVLWLTPLLALLLGGLVAFSYIRRKSTDHASIQLDEARRAEAQALLKD